jgi:3-dehydroquinate synthase
MLHARHIAEGGDPFETGSSRPLDFGHWAAHKLETLTCGAVTHDRAVAAGLALDTLYSVRSGLAPDALFTRVLAVLQGLQLMIYHPALDWREDGNSQTVLAGLDEFREHLGGELTVLMLRDIGQSTDVHQIDPVLVGTCIDELRELSENP